MLSVMWGNRPCIYVTWSFVLLSVFLVTAPRAWTCESRTRWRVRFFDDQKSRKFNGASTGALENAQFESYTEKSWEQILGASALRARCEVCRCRQGWGGAEWWKKPVLGRPRLSVSGIARYQVQRRPASRHSHRRSCASCLSACLSVCAVNASISEFWEAAKNRRERKSLSVLIVF